MRPVRAFFKCPHTPPPGLSLTPPAPAQVMNDLEASKAFIEANIDLVPSALFLRAITAQKLSAQSKNELERMELIKEVRRRYILASDQLFFPLNLEVRVCAFVSHALWAITLAHTLSHTHSHTHSHTQCQLTNSPILYFAGAKGRDARDDVFGPTGAAVVGDAVGRGGDVVALRDAVSRAPHLGQARARASRRYQDEGDIPSPRPTHSARMPIVPRVPVVPVVPIVPVVPVCP